MVIKVKNLDKCLKKVGEIRNIDLSGVIKKATTLVMRTAIDLAPNNTGSTPSGRPSTSRGDLKRSIRSGLVKNKGKVVMGKVNTNLEYAIYQEFGTSEMEAQPFMRPALESNSGDINNMVKDSVKKQLTNMSNK